MSRSHAPRRRPGRSILSLLLFCACTSPEPEPPPPPETLVPLLPAPAAASSRDVDHGGNYMHNFYLPPSPSSTPWAPAWAPDGERVAVGMSGSIWSVELATGVATELTRGERYHSSPTWSPDGRWIVYAADDGVETIRLETLDLQTGETRALTDDGLVYADPVFSPDGSRLAYVSTRPDGYFNVSVRGFRDGSWWGEEVPVTRDHSFGRSRLYFGSWDMHLSPAWTPDGQELLLVSNRDVALGSGNVVRVPARADGIESAVTVLDEQTLYRTRPDVSPDGTRFVYSSTAGAADQYNNLWVQPVEGGEPYKMTFFEHDAFHPRWSPDGQRIVYATNEEGLPRLELLDAFGGRRTPVPIRERVWKEPVGMLRLRVVEAPDTGNALPARVTLLAGGGTGGEPRIWVPAHAYARIGQRGGFPAFHSSGEDSVMLPVGTADVTVMHGFEHVPQRHRVEIRAGATTDLMVRLEPLPGLDGEAPDGGPALDLEGWHNGSTHVHMNYGGNLHNTPENLLFMSAAEDQDMLNELVANKDNRILDYQFFVPGGEPHPLSPGDQLLVVGEEYRPPFYGHVFMLGLEDHLISPFTTGYEGTAIESLYPSNTDMLRKARAQGATVGYVHAFGGNGDPLEGGLGGGKGFMVDAALGTTDAVEWSTAGRAGFFPLYAVWNNDIRITAVGGEDAISNLHWTPLLGAMRTYVRTAGERLTMDGWFSALRDGRAFVTNGPLVSLTVDGRNPGEQVDLPAGGGTVEISARVRSIVPLERVWLVSLGEEVAEVPLAEDRRSAALDTELPVERSRWIHLRAEGSGDERFPLDASWPQAFTNPVWMQVGGAPVRDSASAAYGVRWIDRLEAMARAHEGWRSQEEIDHVLGQFEEARAVYRRLSEGGEGGD